VFRVNLHTLFLELGEQKTWEVPTTSIVEISPGRFARKDFHKTHCWRWEAGWEVDSFVASTKARDSSLKLLQRNEDKRAAVIHKEHAAEEAIITHKIKTLDCDIEVLEMRIGDCPPAVGEIAPIPEVWQSAPAQLKRFKHIEDQFSPINDLRYWPCSDSLRTSFAVFPLSDRHAVVHCRTRSTLVDLVGDVHTGQVESGRRAFILCYGYATRFVVRGNIVWVMKGDETCEAYHMGTQELVDAQPPAFSPINNALVLADFGSIRTRVWFDRTARACVRMVGFCMY
jgi:hypothetical protein